MTAVAILEEAKQRGIVLEAQGEELRYRAPRGSLTPDLLEAMKEHKAELLQSLPQVKVKARIRGKEEIAETASADVCFHCKGERICRCAFCAVTAPRMQWTAGECSACKGTGFLCWPRRVQ